MTREEAAVVAQRNEEQEKLMLVGAGVVGVGGVLCLVLNALNKVSGGDGRRQRMRLDDDFPTP